MQVFQYRPLDVNRPEIRLVHLLRPVEMDGIVHCKIEHVSLNDTPKPTFVALSYAWGDPHVTRPILL